MLASDAFLPTLSSSTLHSVLTGLPKSLSVQHQNKSHGILLIISSILKHSNPTGKAGEVVLSIMDETLETLFANLMTKSVVGLRYNHDGEPVYYNYDSIFNSYSANRCHITRGLYIDIITDLLPFIDHTHHTTPIKLLIKNAEDDLINGQLKGPLTNELPSSLLSLLIVTKPIFKSDLFWNDLLIKSWEHYSQFDDFISHISNSLHAMNTKEMSMIADIAIERTSQELKEVRLNNTA